MSAPRDPDKAVAQYLHEIGRNLASGIAKEHTHRHALQDLIEALDPTVDAFNDPKHIALGAPDFTIRRKGRATDFPVGWTETKDIGEDLNKIEKTDQLKRYFGLPNLVLTDYLEFRWFVDGKLRLKARLATVGRRGKLLPDRDAEQEVITLLSEFLRQTLLGVATPKELAERMADLAHIIRDLLLNAYQGERERGHLHQQFQAFRETLIPDLSPEQFADMYAQTIAYGLFAARCQPKRTPEPFSRTSAADLIPKTNPFLRKLFQAIAFELDDRVIPFVDDLVALLRAADIGSIMADFGKRTAKEDPVVHFYEDFLREYDPKVREMRGVYYTPEPVVSYIVRSVDHLLKTRFDKPLGLADKDVLILDPACGTGTFLYYVIRHIYDTLCQHGQRGQWNSYVSENLLKRVFGFELLMPPYAMAHLKLGLLLQELGYQFDTDERLGVYLTNTLEEAAKKSELLFAQYIADEANAAAEIKREKPIMVVLGNPPYSGHSANKGKWITHLVEDYKRDCPELYKPAQAKWLQDDYVKFIRFGQWRIEKTGHGILGFITNNGYLDNPTFRGMRQQLLGTFSEVFLLDLHGSSKKKERAPDGSKDENVFDIQQGVAIGIFVKDEDEKHGVQAGHSDLWGTRAVKYSALFESSLPATDWTRIEPKPPLFLLIPRDEALFAEYERGWRISDIMNQNGDPAPAIVTTQDEFAISFTSEEAKEKVCRLLATETEAEARRIFRLCSQAQWSYERAKRELPRSDWESKVVPILYRPFDIRWTVYDSNVAVHRRERVMRHMLAGENLGLLTTRQTRDKWDVLATRLVAGHKSLSAYDITSLLPLYAHDSDREAAGRLSGREGRSPNLSVDFIHAVEQSTNLRFVTDSKGDLKATLGPQDVFDYVYALSYSPTYRVRYAEFLKSDFPRVPLTSDKDLFAALVAKGAELVSLHLLESPTLSTFITRYEQPGEHVVEKVRYVELNPTAGIPAGRVYINKTQYFEGVPKEVWEFHIGGYQVCEKWLKDRKGRTLTSDDIDHYQKIVVALSETIRIMREIDEIIPGWPLP
jgi:hypothetical protein